MPHAAVVYDKKSPMKIEEIRLRSIHDNEILVRWAACGVCHSDLSILNELFPCPVPVILGHEAAGVVLEVGAKIRDVTVGDHVVGVWKPGCGTCRYCKGGQSHLCRMGDDPTTPTVGRVVNDGPPIHQFLGVGGFADHAILSSNAFVKIDRGIPLEKAALMGCSVITGFGAATHGAKLKSGDEVVVFGCGGVGLNIIQGAKYSGARVIIAVDLDPAKLEMAKQFGATHTLDGKTPKIRKEIQSLTTDGAGVDYAFDAVGNKEIDAEAYLSTRRGGEVVLVGIAHMADQVAIPQMLTVLQEKSVRGSLAGSRDVTTSIPELIGLYLQKKLKIDELVTKTYSLREANEAMDDLRKGKNARGVLVY